MSEQQSDDFESWVEKNEATLPDIVLPSGNVSISECAKQLFSLIGPTQQMFVRGGVVMGLTTRDDGMLELEVVRPSAARSDFEKFGKLVAWRAGANGEQVLKPVTCSHDMADALLQAQEAQEHLPRVQGLINCAVIHEVDGQLQVASKGYDESTGLLVTGGFRPPTVSLGDAVNMLPGLFAEFDFQSEGDRARAIASLITPALKVGRFLKGRVPADVAEADQSQSGKTFRQKVIAAIYNEQVSLISCRAGGVGSVDESLNQQLVAGRPFIQFDNFRGKFDSAHLEAFLTAEKSFSCRVPHRGEIAVVPENFFIFMTSNGVDTTRDLANRSNIVRIRKRPPGYQFKVYEDGPDLLSHVRAQQPYYLGCIFAVIAEWHRQGKPRSQETRHDFREWVQVSDWICQNIFKTCPIMEGHQQAQERVSNPALVWLRKVVLAISANGDLDKALIASELFELCEGGNIEIPGMGQAPNESKGKKVIGMLMSKLFRDGNTVEVEGFSVTREEKYVARDDPSTGGSFMSKTYTVRKLG